MDDGAGVAAVPAGLVGELVEVVRVLGVVGEQLQTGHSVVY